MVARSSYPPAPTGIARNNALERGWGTGWPDCQRDQIVRVEKAGVAVYVRREIAELVATLLTATERVYRYDVLDGQTWGYACRAIRGSAVASNHSWGLAVDVNSLANPMSTTFQSDIPPAVVAMWWACGFYWGGWYGTRHDPMHFEYVHRPGDVAGDLATARSYLEPPRPDDWTEDLVKNLPTLRRGARGADVRSLQGLLQARGYYKRYKIDGIFGSGTDHELRDFQADKQVPHSVLRGGRGDGIAGKHTWAALHRRRI